MLFFSSHLHGTLRNWYFSGIGSFMYHRSDIYLLKLLWFPLSFASVSPHHHYLWNQVLVTNGREGHQLHEGLAKTVTLPANKYTSPNTSAHYILVSELPRKTQHSQALDGKSFDSPRKRQSKISSNSAHQSLMASRWSRHKAVGLCTPLSCHSRKTLLPLESETLKTERVPEGHWSPCLSQQRNNHWILNRKGYSHRRW